MENWKAIEGYEGGYQVSNLGNVRRIVIINGVLSRKDDLGYRRVFLRPNGRRNSGRLVSIHRLVLAAFVGPVPEKHEVNHKNGDKTDNRLENLEYVTASQNQWHAYHILGKHTDIRGSKHGRSKLTEEQVLEIRRLGAKREIGIGNKLAKQFGIGPQMISFILNRKNWKHI